MVALLKRHKVLSGVGVLILIGVVFLGYRTRGPYRSYRLDFVKPTSGSATPAGAIEVGVAKRDITPDMSLYDPWTDVDNDGRYSPKKGDTYEDRNGNGKFDAVWLAGFNSNRPAKGVHDDLWARAIAVRNNGVTVVMVTIDSIGILHQYYVRVRKELDPSLGIDHVVFSCAHNHEAPDTMGIWSYSILSPQFDRLYLEFVLKSLKEVTEEAVRKLEPAQMVCADLEIKPDGYVVDTRKPIVYDRHVCCARFVTPGTDNTIATLVSWGNHAETLGSGNSLITSDFIHYLREGVENGVGEPNGVKGLGGTCLFFQGMVGGLMTPLRLKVPHRDGKTVLEGDTYEKAQALGENVAILAVNGLRGDKAWRNENTKVAVAAKSVFAPIRGLYGLGCFLGLIHPGWYWGDAKTEIDALRIGDVEILTIPGELYPEIAEGGVESPEGADYPGTPIEAPPLRSQMQGKMNMIFGLANDEIGYIIPKTQWDVKPPYAYDGTRPQYGEENSGGPDIAPEIHREAIEVLNRLHGAL